MENDAARLKQAIEREDLAAVVALMTARPELHRVRIGYGGNGPLTWVAECRVPWGPPSAGRLAIAQWMIDHGSDVHQGGDGPLMRAALNRDRVAMMELLVRNGADVNAKWNGDYPILFGACECVNPVSLRWLLEQGAEPGAALDYLIGTYVRSAELAECIDILRDAGAVTRYGEPGVLDTITGRAGPLGALLDADPALVHRRYPVLDCGSTGARRLLLSGGTLLHAAAEFGSAECAELLLDRGADPNARAEPGGQTPIFHAVSQFDDHGLEVARLLIARGADLAVVARLPGHYERPEEFVECTPLEYALRFPGEEAPGSNAETIELLRSAQRS